MAASKVGVVHASEQRSSDLRQVFAKMKPEECSWTAVLSLGRYAVLAGTTSHDISNGSKYPKEKNLFLLLKLASLAVLNQHEPLRTEWTLGASS